MSDIQKEQAKHAAAVSHKRNPSLNYYLKNDFQQKKEKDLNLSYSQSPPVRNQSTELARGGLNNSRSQVHQSYVQSPNTGHTNFRIGTLSNNASHEYSNSKKKKDLNNSGQIANNSQDERSKQGSKGGAVFQRRSSKVLLSRNGSQKLGTNESQAAYIQQRMIPSTGQSEYNLMAGLNRNSEAGQNCSASNDVHKKQVQIEFKLKDQVADMRSPNDTNAKNSRKQLSGEVDTIENLRSTEVGNREVVQKEPAVVHWADCINGQDIRTELKFGDCLGQGSFAKVYEGFDKKLKMPVAIKVIDKRKIKDTETKKKALIEEEIYIFAKLDHPNIVKFIRLIEDVKRVYHFYHRSS